MPVAATYPGVYIEEIPSGVRTITGVATSIAAFIGRAARGPTDEPITINGYGDFERIYGGLWTGSRLGYAVRDFFLNGGGQAIIVRLFEPSDADQASALLAAQAVSAAAQASAGPAATDVATAAETEAAKYAADPAKKAAANAVAKAARDAATAGKTVAETKQAAANAVATAAPATRATLSVGTLNLQAATPGAWGKQLRARVDHDVTAAAAARYGLTADDLFNLTVRDMGIGYTEQFRNVSVVSGPRQVDKVLANQSTLVRAVLPLPNARPDENDKGLSAAELAKAPFSDPNEKRSSGVAADSAVDDGQPLDSDSFIGAGTEGSKLGLYALKRADLFNILAIPPYTTSDDVDQTVVTAAGAFCEARRAMLLVDCLSSWTDKDKAKSGIANDLGTNSKNSAVFFPRLTQPDPLSDNQLADFVPCGAIAGIFARTDTNRGVWKAPAGLDATLVGVPDLSVHLTDGENGELNPLGVNCLRTLPPGVRVVWGSRTLQGDDRLASEWKYIAVRRTALFIEESLYRGTQWVVFEPNDEPLWSQIRLNVGAFMHNLFRQGAFQGKTPQDAYFVKCDKETTTQNDINLGVVNIVVGFAPLKPAEFVIIQIQQIAGQVAA
jgi:phage tail sheath protein FI